MDLVVLVSGAGSNLRAIARAIDEKTCRARIAAVVSDRGDAAALELARSSGVATNVVPLAKGADRGRWSEELADVVASRSPDLVVLAGFMRILSPEFITRFRGRIINVHPSLLPSFPGHDAPLQAVRARVRLSGCTVHVVDEGVDTGPILAQAAVPVLPTDDAESLHDRIRISEHALLPRVIDWIAEGRILLDPVRVEAPLAPSNVPVTWPPLDWAP